MIINPMLPTLSSAIPEGKKWVHECKYDGYRCIAFINEHEIVLQSRNQKVLSNIFPEIVEQLEKISCLRPIVFDGELAILESNFKANFSKIQKRGRMRKNNVNINVFYLVFDLLMINGVRITNLTFLERKSKLMEFMKSIEFPIEIDFLHPNKVQMIPFYNDIHAIWKQIEKENGEGIVSKKIDSLWNEGQRTKDWLKIKNLQTSVFILFSYIKSNGYFSVGLIKDGKIIRVGVFKDGLSKNEMEALYTIILKNKLSETNEEIFVTPGICVELEFLEWNNDSLRHVKFVRFRLDYSWEDCIWE